MKTIAMYLPQFHRVKENDAWWGEGYTEWTAVKNAKPLFEGHDQPRVPLHENYYDLLEKSTMEEQAELAQQYGVDGFCFYHYYFKDGRKILEKPAENLLNWTDIKLPFCFCWANETWARTWSNVGNKNSWNEQLEVKGSKSESGVLLQPDYGKEAEWEEHFYYLLPFFKDERYIKYNGRPVFLIYKPKKLYCLLRMMQFWKQLAKKEEIPEIYVIGVNVGYQVPGIDAALMLEPGACRNIDLTGEKIQIQRKNGITICSYEEMFAASGYDTIEKGKTYLSVAAGYDDTPRRGKNGYCFLDVTPKKFEEKLTEVFAESIRRENEFVFINAWNEWGEGMYLEPDEKNGFGYLEALFKSLQNIKTGSAQKQNDTLVLQKADTEARRELERLRGQYDLLHSWFQLKEQGRSAAEYFERNHYDNIAIYGWGVYGQHLFKDLKQAGARVSCIIDKAQNEAGVISIGEFLRDNREASVVVVTPIYAYGEVYRELADKIDVPMISLEEVIQSLVQG